VSNRPAEEWHISSDESGLDRKQIAIGVIVLPAGSISGATETLEAFCSVRYFSGPGDELAGMQLRAQCPSVFL